MWPLVEVHSTAAAWGYFAILWIIIILGPMILSIIIDRVWWRKHYERKFMVIDQRINHGQSKNLGV